MTNAEIKNRILMEMSNEIDDIALRKLKMCLERNLYGATITDDCTDVVKVESETNEKMLTRFCIEQKINGLSDKTILQYKRETERFFTVVDKNYSEVVPDDISFYLAFLMGKGTMSVNSVDNARKFLKPFFKWLCDTEKIPKDIFRLIKPIKRVEKKKDFLNEDEIVKLRDACQEDVRALALIDFLLSTGIRVSECSSLKLENINFNNGIVDVYATKTRQWRKVFLDSNAMKHLKDYLSSRDDSSPYVFMNERKYKGKLTRMRNESMEKLIHKYCKKADIYRDCNVHLFRKTLATRLYKRGADLSIIAKILGHVNVHTTEKHYLTIQEQDIQYMYKKCIS